MTSTKRFEHHIYRVAVAIAAITALLSFLYSLWIAIRYNGNGLLNPSFSFRQSQTEITAYWACHDGFRLAYETPVAGYPWAVPFEFPIYQWLVALLSCRTGLPEGHVGCYVSYAFLVACIWPAERICKSLFKTHWLGYFLAFASILFSAPIDVFFGPAFLIETAALFFTLGFVAYMIRMIQGNRSRRTLILTALFMTLAILQKAPTILPLLPFFAAAFIYVNYQDIRTNLWRAYAARAALATLIIPFLIGTAWVKYTDAIKVHNAFGRGLTSSVLTEWNFGGDRLDWHLWLWVIWYRNVVTNLGGWLGLGIALLGLAVLDRRHRIAMVSGTLLFLLYFMIFTNIQFRHEYYQISNEFLVIFTLAVAIGGMMALNKHVMPLVGALALVALIATNVRFFTNSPNYKSLHHRVGTEDPVLESAYFVRDHTDPSKPIVVFGDDWNSEFPLYSERKGLAMMAFFPQADHVIAKPSDYLGGTEPSAVMVCRDWRSRPGFEERVKAAFNPTSVQHLAMCDILLKP